jgi:hypothetical protein
MRSIWQLSTAIRLCALLPVSFSISLHPTFITLGGTGLSSIRFQVLSERSLYGVDRQCIRSNAVSVFFFLLFLSLSYNGARNEIGATISYKHQDVNSRKTYGYPKGGKPPWRQTAGPNRTVLLFIRCATGQKPMLSVMRLCWLIHYPVGSRIDRRIYICVSWWTGVALSCISSALDPSFRLAIRSKSVHAS